MARKAKSKRKNKQKKRMPPLSLLDKTIYGILILLSFGLYIGIIFLSLFLCDRVAHSAPDVLAAIEGTSILWAVIPAFVPTLIALSLFGSSFSDSRPIFGKKGIKYGPPQYPPVYPIFMKNKPPVWVSEAQKKSRKTGAIVLLILIVVSILPYPLSIYGRDSLQTDGSIIEYNIFNRESEYHQREDVVAVEFSLKEDNSGESFDRNRTWFTRILGKVLESRSYTVCVTITTDDGERFVFRSGDFLEWGRDERTSWLPDMLLLKSLFPPECVTCEDADKLVYAVRDYALNEQDAELLYELFSVDQG